MLITEDYRKQQKLLHENPNYGTASIGFAPTISMICNRLGVTNLLDYGAGKGNLAKNLKVDHPMRIQMYDPAIPEWSDPPEPSELVCCVEVLEHIEPDCLDSVLDDLESY